MAAAAQHYHDSIISVLEKHASVKMRTIRSNIAKPWYSDVIHEARQLRRRCERKWLKTRLEIQRELYVRQQERVVRLINSAKRTTSEPPSPRQRQVTRTKSIRSSDQHNHPVSLPSHGSEQELADLLCAVLPLQGGYLFALLWMTSSSSCRL